MSGKPNRKNPAGWVFRGKNKILNALNQGRRDQQELFALLVPFQDKDDKRNLGVMSGTTNRKKKTLLWRLEWARGEEKIVITPARIDGRAHPLSWVALGSWTVTD